MDLGKLTYLSQFYFISTLPGNNYLECLLNLKLFVGSSLQILWICDILQFFKALCTLPPFIFQVFESSSSQTLANYILLHQGSKCRLCTIMDLIITFIFVTKLKPFFTVVVTWSDVLLL